MAKLEIPGNIENFSSINHTVTGTFTLDGYVIDPSNATTGQVLKYNGSSFVADNEAGGSTIGSLVSGGTSTYVLYVDGSANLAQDSYFVWNPSTKRLNAGYGVIIAGSGAAVSGAGEGAIRFNSGHLEFSENGSSYVPLSSASVAIGSSVTSGMNKSILYIDSSGHLAQDNSNFTWDMIHHRLGLGTNSPGYTLDIRTPADVSSFHLRTGSSNDDGLYMNAGASGGTISIGAKNIGSNTWQARSTVAALIDTQAGLISFYTDSGLISGNTFTPTKRLTLDISGNLLLGSSTTSSGKLQIQTQDSAFGQIQIANTKSNSEASISFISGATTLGKTPVSTNGTDHVWSVGAGIFGISGAKFGFGTVASDASFITLDGANHRLGVGLGNASPATTLDVGNARTTASIALRAGSTAATSSINTGRIRYNENSQHFEISESSGAYKQISTGAGTPSITMVADINYITNGSQIIVYTSISDSRIVTGVTGGSASTPFIIILKDGSGSVSASNAIVFVPSTGTIDGRASIIAVDKPYGSAQFFCDGTNWWLNNN